MKKLAEIGGSHASKVELVEIDGKKYVLKTSSIEEIAAEKFYYNEVEKRGLPTLKILERKELEENQVLIEYIEGSPTLEESVDLVLYKEWGQLVRRTHDIHFDTSFHFGESGDQEQLNWSSFLEREVDLIKDKKNLSDKLFERAIETLASIPKTNTPFSLLHCDLHQSNVLIRGDKPHLFDVGGDMSSGDPFYDLAIIAINLPNKLYINDSSPKHANDQLLRDAFIDGYGSNFIESSRDLLDWYVLLRAMQRHPNKFEPHLLEVITTILERH